MKKILVLMSLISLALMITFSACKKDEEEATPETFPTAIIKGHLDADLNTANDTSSTGGYLLNKENAPSGTTVIATINTFDLFDDPTNAPVPYNTKKLTYTATADGNGDYSIEIPAKAQTVTVSLEFVDFTYDQVTMDIYPNTKSERTILSAASAQATVVEGDTEIIDAYYQ